MGLGTFLNGRPPLRGLIWLGLSSTGKVLKRTTTPDGAGGQTETYTPQSAVACRIDPMGGGDAKLAERVSERSTATITMQPSVAVSAKDDFRVDGVGDFEVTAVRQRTGALTKVIEVADRV